LYFVQEEQNDYDWEISWLAIEADRVDILRVVHVDRRVKWDSFLIILAARKSKWAAVDFCLQNGCLPSSAFPLDLAKKGKVDVLQRMLDLGIPISNKIAQVKVNDNETAAWIVANKNNFVGLSDTIPLFCSLSRDYYDGL